MVNFRSFPHIKTTTAYQGSHVFHWTGGGGAKLISGGGAGHTIQLSCSMRTHALGVDVSSSQASCRFVHPTSNTTSQELKSGLSFRTPCIGSRHSVVLGPCRTLLFPQSLAHFPSSRRRHHGKHWVRFSNYDFISSLCNGTSRRWTGACSSLDGDHDACQAAQFFVVYTRLPIL